MLFSKISVFLVGCPLDNNDGTRGDLYSWEYGTYLSSSFFGNQCSTPRTGTDPFTNTDYPDLSGSEFLEKMYLRSFSHETYLWYNELPDDDPDNSSSVAHYFDSLKSPELTPSGKAKDQFHFTQSYEEYMSVSQLGESFGFGFNWKVLSIFPSLNYSIKYAEVGSPADNAGIERGDRLMVINGVNFLNPSTADDYDTINQALFSPTSGQVVNFEFQSPDGTSKNVNLVADSVALSPVMNETVIENNGKKIGYMQFNAFIVSAQPGLIQAFTTFNNDNIDALVIDLRYNGGGLIYEAAQLGFMIAGEQSRDRVFETLTYSDKRTQDNVNIDFFPNEIDWENNTILPQTLSSVELSEVYIITTSTTASASESLINGLRGIDVSVIQIGSTTRGKPYGFLPEKNCGTVYYTIQFNGKNGKGFGDYADGFTPTPIAQTPNDIGLDSNVEGCTVEDNLNFLLGDPNEPMFAAAIQYIGTGTCPVSASTNRTRQPETPYSHPLPFLLPNYYLENKIHTPLK